MSLKKKRIRSINWDEEEKQLFRSVLKEFATSIENKSLDNNANQLKTKAWEEVQKKFNELNGRLRSLNELKIQWKTMKINARKEVSLFKRTTNKTGGGGRPQTPINDVIEINDLLNPAELLRDENIILVHQQVKIQVRLGNKQYKSNNYVDTLVNYTKTLKDQEHQKRLDILEVELNIQKEKLKSAILEREILEIRKAKELM